MHTWLPAIFSVGAWGFTIALVYTMLSGTFDTRTCQTACVQTLFWTAFALSVVGVAYGLFSLSGGEKRGVATTSVIASSILLIIFATTMVIGIIKGV